MLNNDYHVSRGKEHIFSAGLSEQCCSLKGDFMNMPIADNTFDAAYAIQATCYAPEAVNTLEFLRIAPAGSVGAYNVLTSASDGLLKGGREGIFTASFFVLGRKPLKETEIVNDGNL
ncbi:hypothetical protein ZEAMMB73_Zm00001d044846 [Zea mays]|uniref:Sterol methyltransferase C-terminal domain-containing protein n=1 Tax=Zea mays TaxID=4577 RepID=A0A1D6NRV6_MAIZE|nr:hypothetical protein ZEAMMB73_Zm00001d044846 [Zea mays]